MLSKRFIVLAMGVLFGAGLAVFSQTTTVPFPTFFDSNGNKVMDTQSNVLRIYNAGTAVATLGSYVNGINFNIDNANSIVGIQGLLAASLGVNDTVDWGSGQGRVVGINGITAANNQTNASMIRMQAFGAGGNVYIGSDASGSGNVQPITFVMCSSGACLGALSTGSQIAQMGIRNTFGGGFFVGTAGTVPATGIINAQNGYQAGGTSIVTSSGAITPLGGSNVVFRCATSGNLRTGALTITSGDCGTTTDTGLRVP